jgi:hypothetical protein
MIPRVECLISLLKLTLNMRQQWAVKNTERMSAVNIVSILNMRQKGLLKIQNADSAVNIVSPKKLDEKLKICQCKILAIVIVSVVTPHQCAR